MIDAVATIIIFAVGGVASFFFAMIGTSSACDWLSARDERKKQERT